MSKSSDGVDRMTVRRGEVTVVPGAPDVPEEYIPDHDGEHVLVAPTQPALERALQALRDREKDVRDRLAELTRRG